MARVRGSRGFVLVAVLVVVGLLAGCRPTGERRLVSLRETRLTDGQLHGQLVYVETRGVRRSVLYVHDLAHDERERVPVPAGYANGPAWSPDGEQIAFSLTDRDGYSHIWVVRPDGSGLRQLTDGPVVDDHPRWAPDGRELVFTSIRDDDYDWRLFRLAVDGEGPTPVTTATGHSVFPDWSPDGRYLVYANRSGPTYKLRLHDLVAGTERALTTGPGQDLYPRFSPDGREVLFSTNRDDDVWQIEVIDLATDASRRIIGSDSMDEFPVFSPDMRHVVFSAGHLAIYRSDGGEVADGRLRWSVTRNLAWSPDWKADHGPD